MKVRMMCMECTLKQVRQVADILNVPENMKRQALKEVFEMLSHLTYEESNPEIMGETLKIISRIFKNNDPYKQIKLEYNQAMMVLYPELIEKLDQSSNALQEGLKLAVLGNLIDFGARHTFTKEDVLKRIEKLDDYMFAIDDRSNLFEQLNKAKTLFYIGDNCGEIVFDKIFIREIKKHHPQITVFYGVRGGNVINDVTEEDAYMTGIDEFATIMSSGIAYPGTVLKACSKAFNKRFETADLIIAKGQGNYESLSDVIREGLFFVFMAKCPYVAENLKVKELDYIIKENK